MHKDECDPSGGQRCSEENMEEMCQEGHEGYEKVNFFYSQLRLYFSAFGLSHIKSLLISPNTAHSAANQAVSCHHLQILSRHSSYPYL